MTEWLLTNWTSIGVLLGPLLTWLASKRHYQKKELKIKDADLMTKNLQIYQDMLDDVVERKEQEIKQLEAKLDELNEEVKKLREVIKIMTANGTNIE